MSKARRPDPPIACPFPIKSAPAFAMSCPTLTFQFFGFVPPLPMISYYVEAPGLIRVVIRQDPTSGRRR